MDVPKLKQILTETKKQVLGIPIVLPSMVDTVFPLAKWSLEGSPLEARQVWFCTTNAKEIQSTLPAQIRNRILPIPPQTLLAYLKRGPFDSLLLPHHGFEYADPNLTLTSFWKTRGSYVKCEEVSMEELQLWFWKSHKKPLRLFGLDHHHAVLWDVKEICRPLGVTVDFAWLSDGRPPVNEAIPMEVPGFRNSLDIYKPAVDQALTPEFLSWFQSQHYDGIVTSHSLVTCYRLKELNLPHIHVNSTRFGNEWIQNPERHSHLVNTLQTLLKQDRLYVVHNNKGDKDYFRQFVSTIQPHQELVVPSLCESPLRLRLKPPATPKFLLWDPRQLLLQPDKSVFMREIYVHLKKALGDAFESQAILMTNARSYLPEGYLDDYTAVIHIPYNVSTMSMFQHVRSNIPIWVPSKELLQKLWTDPKEPNELSWTVFAPGTETTASPLDQARDPRVIKRWIDTADFYNPEVLPLALPFDSLEDLTTKLTTTDYQTLMDASERTQQAKREDIVFAWEQVLQGLNKKT
jgi:hypothetical protein